MASFEIPSTGFQLSPSRADKATANNLSPILRLDLLQEKTKDILNFLKAGKSVHLHTGKQPSIQYGEHRLKLQNGPDTFSSDVYSRAKGSGEKLYFAGKLNHTLEVQRARDDTVKVDGALAALQNSLKSIKEEKAMNETSFVSSREEMRQLGKAHRPSPLLGGRKDPLDLRSTPGSPYLNAANSPRPGPTSAPLLSSSLGSSSTNKIRLEAIKIPLLHLLASRPMSAKVIADRLRAPRADCDRLLDKHAFDSQAVAGKKELRDKSYRELDVWRFPYSNDEDRKTAIDRAVHAYDRLRLDKHDPVWQLLLPKKERGKGKVLSKLNFDKPTPSLKPPKVDDKGDASDVESKAARKVSEKRKAERGDEGPKKKVKTSSPAATKKKEVRPGRSPLPESKVKSSERIVDSDEEADAVPVATAEPAAVPVKKERPSTAPASPVIKRAVSPAPKKQLHKSTLSSSSSSGDNGDPLESKHSLKPPPKEAAAAKHSPRPRHGSSPQKPSPLGSSPPTNSTDTDSSSNGKAASQSSAPSSPPSSTEMPMAKQRNKYSPVITERPRDVSRGRPSVKRKLDEHEDEVPAKRQQMNEVSANSRLTNDVTQDKPALERKISESERSSSPDKAGPARDDVMEEAKRFQLYYKKYKINHEKLSKIPEEERDQKEMDDLLKMHQRLKEMKAEIWQNWDKVEKPTG